MFWRVLMAIGFSEGKASAASLSESKVQEPGQGTQEEENGEQGVAQAERGQLVADGGIPGVLLVYTDGDVAQFVIDAAQLPLGQEETGAAQLFLFALIFETDAGPGTPACVSVELSFDDGVCC